MNYTQDRLNDKTARFAAGYEAVCLFVNDTADAESISVLSMCGVRLSVYEKSSNERCTNKLLCLLFSSQVKLIVM
jgi:hypothetical protein